MIENANSGELRSALEEHLQETRRHVSRLEQAFAAIGVEPDNKSNDILVKMASAAEDSISNIEASPLRDTTLIANGNLVEHYEIAIYGTLAAFARSLGLVDVTSLFVETLGEEKKGGAKLTQIGEQLLSRQVAKSQTV
jgi:ferritin-like metal-binding protein YciE